MKPIILIGMPGAGKSTAGRLIAEKTGMNFYDTDNIIEKSENKSVNEIFEQNGEKYFRKIEAEIIQKLPKSDCVISIGGGAFETPQTRELLLKNSLVIYLEADPEIIYERIKNQTHRPLLLKNPQKKISELLKKREKNYKLAHLTVMTDNKTTEQVAKEILRCANLK